MRRLLCVVLASILFTSVAVSQGIPVAERAATAMRYPRTPAEIVAEIYRNLRACGGFWHCDILWEQTTGPVGAVISSVAVKPDGALFVSSENNLFRSTDAAATWANIGPNKLYRVYSATPVSGNTMLVATSNGVYRSTNNGDTWIAAGLNTESVEMVMQTASGKMIASLSYDYPRQSTDGGATWSELTGVWGRAGMITAAGTVFLGTNRSTDDGATWTTMTFPGGIGENIVNAFSTSATGVLVAAMSLGVWTSTDDGVTWTQKFSTYYGAKIAVLNAAGDVLATNGFGLWKKSGTAAAVAVSGPWGASGINTVTRAPSGRLYVGAAGLGMFVSTDGGATWTEANGTSTDPAKLLIGSYVNHVAVNSNKHLFTSSSAGIAKSSDDGATWTRVGLSGLRWPWGPAIGPSNEMYVTGSSLSGLMTYYVYRSTDAGATWTQRMASTHLSIDEIHVSPSGTLFALGNDYSTWQGGVYRSTDDGATWTGVRTFEYISISSLGINSSGHVYNGQDYGWMERSTDNGAHWTSSRLADGFMYPAYSLGFTSSGHVLAGTQDGLFRSTDNGTTWTRRGLSGKNINELQVGPGDVIYVRAYPEEGSTGDIYRSTDEGGSWTNITGNLEGRLLRSISAGGNRRFVATGGQGVWRNVIATRTPVPFAHFAAKDFFRFLDRCFEIPGAGSGHSPSCPPDPGCPECTISMATVRNDTSESLLRSVLDVMRDLAGNRVAPATGRSRLVALFNKTAGGTNLSRERRDSLVADLAALKDVDATRVVQTAFAGLNALDIDTRLPASTAKIAVGNAAARRGLTFGEFAAVSLEGTRPGQSITITVTDRVPAIPSGYALTWPLATYELRIDGGASETVSGAVSFRLPGLQRGRYGANPRVLEWDEKGFRDVTVAIDQPSDVISASINGWPTAGKRYIIADRGVPAR